MATEQVMNLEIQVQLDDKGAVKGIKTLDDKTEKFGKTATTASGSTNLLKNAIGALGIAAVGSKFIGFMKDGIAASAAQETTFAKLANSMGQVGVSYNDTARELQGMLSQLQDTTKYGDTDTAEALQRLVSITGDYNGAVQLLAPSLDFATAMNISLSTASRLVGQTVAGNIGALSRYGIVLDDATKELLKNASAAEASVIVADLLNSKFGGAAAAQLDTYGGRVDRLTNYWGDFTEAMGAVITKGIAAPGIFDNIVESIKGMIEWAQAFGEVVVFFTNLDFGAAIQAYAKKASAAYYRLFANLYDMVKDLPEWLGGGKKAAGMSTALNAAAAALDKMAETDLDAVFDKANEAAIEYRKEVNNLTSSASGPGGLDEALDTAGEAGKAAFDGGSILAEAMGIEVKSTKELLAEMGETAEREGWTLKQAFENAANGPKELARGVKTAFDDIDADAATLTDSLQGSFEDLVSKGFVGELNSFSDVWDSIWKDLAKSMTTILLSDLADVFGKDGKGFKDLTGEGGLFGKGGPFDNSGNSAGEKAAGLAGGLGGVMQAYESGDPLGGAMSGAMAGSQFGLIGAAVGGAIGLLAGLFGGEDDPSSNYRFENGEFEVTRTRGQDLEDGAWAKWEDSMNSLVRESTLAYRGLVKLFGDSELLDLVGNLGDFSVDGSGGSLEDLAEYIANEWLPEKMDDVFGLAIRTGLGDLGVQAETVDQIFAELAGLSGEDRITALQDVIAVLVMFDEALTDFGTGKDLIAFLERSPMRVFAEDMVEVRDKIDLVTAGWESMDLSERAREAQEIGTLFQGALSTTLGLLQQIEGIRTGVADSFSSLDERLNVGGMNSGEQFQYFFGQVNDLMAQLRSGDVEDPAEIARISADLQRYIEALSGVVNLDSEVMGGFMDLPTGMDWREYLREMLGEAAGFADEALVDIEDEVLAEYALLIAAMEEARVALLGFAGAAGDATGGDAGAGGGAGDDPLNTDPKTIVVTQTNEFVIEGSISPLISLIDGRISTIIGGNGNNGDSGPGGIY